MAGPSRGRDVTGALRRALASAAAPPIFGLLTAASLAWGWGSRAPLPSTSDEASYLLQAKIFSTGHWTAPARPLPRFFEQMHEFVTPVTASKYPPGHALLLAPGVLAGAPALMPVLLGGLTGGLLFALARRLADGPTALVAGLLWATSSGVRLYSTTFLSEVTTTALWLAGWASLLAWRRGGRRGWLVLLALCAAWAALTRPLTALVFAAFAGAAVLAEARRRRSARGIGMAALASAAVLAVIPLWSRKTTGSFRTTPYALYSRLYFPYEKPGFGLDPSPAERPIPAGFEPVDRFFRETHRRHTLRSLPMALVRRTAAVGGDMWRGREVLILFFLIGVFGAGAEAGFVLAASGALLLAYLVYAHDARWTIYYVETLPTLAFFTADGLGRAFRAAARRLRRSSDDPDGAGALAAGLMVLAALAVAGSSIPMQLRIRAGRSEVTREARDLLGALRARGPTRSLVFVDCAEAHLSVCLLINGEPSLGSAPVWFVHDLGPEDRDLARLASDRVPFRYAADGVLRPLETGRAHGGPL